MVEDKTADLCHWACSLGTAPNNLGASPCGIKRRLKMIRKDNFMDCNYCPSVTVHGIILL